MKSFSQRTHKITLWSNVLSLVKLVLLYKNSHDIFVHVISLKSNLGLFNYLNYFNHFGIHWIIASKSTFHFLLIEANTIYYLKEIIMLRSLGKLFKWIENFSTLKIFYSTNSKSPDGFKWWIWRDKFMSYIFLLHVLWKPLLLTMKWKKVTFILKTRELRLMQFKK